MRKLMIVLAAGILAFTASAKGVEQISIVENEIATINVPFGITSYLPSNMDVVRIEEVSGTSLRITALRRGRCDLDVRGDKDLAQKYEITVLGDLATTLDTLNSELDQVQEVRARIVGDFIRIEGEVSSIQKWEYLQKVLRGYPDVARNFAVFSPGPDVMLRLKDTLQESGFTVVFQSLGKDRKAWPANQIALVLNKQTQIMQIQGRVYTPEQKAKVSECLSTERWLTLNLNPNDVKAEANEYQIRGQFDVFVDKPQIRISVAYMAIGDTDLEQIGNQNATTRDGVLNVSGLLESLGAIVANRGTEHNDMVTPRYNSRFTSSTASYGATLDVTANFLKQNGITRVSDTGYTVMESWEKDGAKFKSGGTLYVKTQGLNAGDLKEIDYGFILNTKGGLVETGDAVDTTIDFTLSSIDGIVGDEINKKEDSTRQKLKLPLGRTTFLGGVKMLDEDRMSPSGLPFLRSTPMLNWFVSDSSDTINDKKLVIMICPEIIDNTKDGNIDVEKEVNIPVSTEGVKTAKQREDEKRPFKGGLWNPLNWFAF